MLSDAALKEPSPRGWPIEHAVSETLNLTDGEVLHDARAEVRPDERGGKAALPGPKEVGACPIRRGSGRGAVWTSRPIWDVPRPVAVQ